MTSSIKPTMSKEEKKLLKEKNEQARKRVEFRRQEWFRYKKFGEEYRKPRGYHSKMREKLARRPPVVDVGYRGPKAVRYLHPSGFQEVLVHNLAELEAINPAREACRISATVGLKKREVLEGRADELGIRILNRKVQ
ncbi:MAG: 50S ribosomal protein L32e [Cuniculiplasma sp.]